MAIWVLRLAGCQHSCEVISRRRNTLQLELEEPVRVKSGRWGLLIPPGGKTQLVVEVSRSKTSKLIDCYLLGTFMSAPLLCLACGCELSKDEIVRNVPGMNKQAAREICFACWEVEAARLMRPSPEQMGQYHVEDESKMLEDNMDFDPDD